MVQTLLSGITLQKRSKKSNPQKTGNKVTIYRDGHGELFVLSLSKGRTMRLSLP